MKRSARSTFKDISIFQSSGKILPSEKESYFASFCKTRHTFTPSRDSRDCFQSSMIFLVAVGRMLSLMPVQGFTGENAMSTRYVWCSPGVLYTVTIMMSTLVMVLICFIKTVTDGYDFEDSSIIFATIVFVSNLLFLQLATRWPTLCLQWQEMEIIMQQDYGYPKNVTLKFHIITSIVLLASFIEHFLSYLQRGFDAVKCTNGSLQDWFLYFSIVCYPQVFKYTGYSPWLMILLIFFYLIFAFIWNYMDLFVILMSISLSSRFKLISSRLKEIRGEVMPAEFWKTLREDYNRLSNLSKYVDFCVSKIILLSFASNLYFICLQLFHSLHRLQGIAEITYFYYSFAYLLLRSVCVCLCAASVHDESKAPKSVLYSVPSSCYNMEVQRLIHQVTFDDISLTGCGLFSVTRSFFLTVVGTIITYEIFLVQFKNISSDENNGSTNNTCFTDYKNYTNFL